MKVYINKFDGGMVNDPCNPAEGVCRVCTNFDALTNPYKLTPYQDSEDGSSSQTTQKIQNFAVALGSASTYRIFGLGVTPGGGVGEIYFKTISTGAATDLDDAGWGETANNADSAGAVNFNLFVYYKINKK